MMLLYTTISDLQLAEKMAENALESGLCGCVNIIPGGISIYKENGEIYTSSECYVLFKTSDEKYDALQKLIQAIHPYDIPCILSIKADMNIPYRDWILSQMLPIEAH
jgi:periplasmic divalent cation tolerance protein